MDMTDRQTEQHLTPPIPFSLMSCHTISRCSLADAEIPAVRKSRKSRNRENPSFRTSEQQPDRPPAPPNRHYTCTNGRWDGCLSSAI